METADSDPTAAESAASTLAAAVHVLRERSRSLLREQDERLRDLEQRLEQQYSLAIERLEREPRQIDDTEQELFDRVESLEREVRRLQQLKQESEQALDEARTLLGELEEERRVLRNRLDHAEQRLDGTAPAVPGDTEETERLHRRLELAMQEIRDLKVANEQFAEQAKRSPKPGAPAGDQWDWESQKRRLLEQLETSFDPSNPAEMKEKIRCEEVIRATDRVIAEKDRAIEELRQQLANQIANTPAAPDPREAAAEVLDADAVVQAERQRLAELQATWEEKLRQAEVEVSIERAKIARERMQLEEKLRMLPTKTTEAVDPQGGDGKAGSRGRWLARLGLRGDKEKDGET